MNPCFDLPEDLTIYQVARTRDDLLAWMEAPAHATVPLYLNASAVQRVDGAGLQLLMALDASGRAWHLQAASGPFAETCELMGLAHWLSGMAQENPA